MSFAELQLNLSDATPTPRWGEFSGHLGGGFVFVPKQGCGAAAPPPAIPARDPDAAAIGNARLQNTEDAWQRYLDTWPRGHYRKEAQDNLDQLQEDRVWQAAEITKTAAAYQNYQAIYCPGGRFCAEITQRLAELDQLVFIKGGTFPMGSTERDDEKPVHSVTVADFYLAKYEVTVAEFQAFIEANPAYQTDAEKEGYSWKYTDKWEQMTGINWRHDAAGELRPPTDFNHPVLHVSWNDAMAYCAWRSKKTGQNYRLPTEAEWEYAAGNGTRHTKYSWGNAAPSGKNGGNVADESKRPADGVGWATKFDGFNDGYWFTAPVGSYNPNDFGLYDMTGNVWEWCSDWYSADYYKNSPSVNPSGPASGSDRVARGGSWSNVSQNCRPANRYVSAPGNRYDVVGFRLARTK